MIKKTDKYVAAVETHVNGRYEEWVLCDDGTYLPMAKRKNVAVFTDYGFARDASHRLLLQFPDEGSRPFVRRLDKLV